MQIRKKFKMFTHAYSYVKIKPNKKPITRIKKAE